MKKMSILLALASVCICMTACGNNSSETAETSTTEPAIKVYEEQFTTVATEPETTESAEDVKKLVPDIKQNMSDEIDLSLVSINSYEINLNTMNYATVMDIIDLQETIGFTQLDTDAFYFESSMYGLTNEGTQVSIEVVDKDGNLVSDTDEYDANELYVKGIRSSAFFTKEDFEIVYYSGIRTGMTKDYVVALLGNGDDLSGINDDKIYKNSTYSMIVEFSNSTDAEGNSVDLVDEITLIKN